MIGATGMIGQPVTRVLLDAGLDITLMARNVPKDRAIFPNAHIVHGDVFDPLGMLPVFEGKLRSADDERQQHYTGRRIEGAHY